MQTRLTCMCTCPCAGDHMHLREYYERMFERKLRKKKIDEQRRKMTTMLGLY